MAISQSVLLQKIAKPPKHRDSDTAEELESTVLGINIYEDYVEIELGE